MSSWWLLIILMSTINMANWPLKQRFSVDISVYAMVKNDTVNNLISSLLPAKFSSNPLYFCRQLFLHLLLASWKSIICQFSRQRFPFNILMFSCCLFWKSLKGPFVSSILNDANYIMIVAFFTAKSSLQFDKQVFIYNLFCIYQKFRGIWWLLYM